MGISLADQTMDFLLALAFGAGLGALYDVFRILRALIPTGKILIFFEDLLYWCVCGVLTFLFILGVNAGEIRGYLIVGELLGAMVYYGTIGRLIMRSAQAISRGIRCVLRFLRDKIIKPIFRPFVKAGGKMRHAVKKAGNHSKKLSRSSKYRLKRTGILLYNLFNISPKRKEKKSEAER